MRERNLHYDDDNDNNGGHGDDDAADEDRDDYNSGIHIPHKKLKQKLMQWSQNIDERMCSRSCVCVMFVCTVTESARSHKNYRHEFQSAFSNNKLGCLFLCGSSLLLFFSRSSFSSLSSVFCPLFYFTFFSVCALRHESCVSFTFPCLGTIIRSS